MPASLGKQKGTSLLEVSSDVPGVVCVER